MVLLGDGAQHPPLAVTPDRYWAQLVLHGVLLDHLTTIRRPMAEARRLMTATADLRCFRDLRMELGSAWADAHFALCSELQPVFVPAGELIFSSATSLKRPLVILAGQAALLSQPPPLGQTDLSSRSLADEQPEEATVLLPGDCITNATTSWLQPLAVAGVARTDMQLLCLPGTVFAERLQMPLLRLLQRRERVLSSLPLLRNCPASGLRALAHAAFEATHAPSAAICSEGEPCDGLQVLVKGSARVCARLSTPGLSRPKPTPAAAAALAKSSSAVRKAIVAPPPQSPPCDATEVQMAEIQAPELCGIIDVMLSVLQRGREVQSLAPPPRRAAAVGLAADTPFERDSFAARHGASVLAVTGCRTLKLRTVDVLRHAGPSALVDLAGAAHDRSIIRSSLRAELLRQAQRKHASQMGASYRNLASDGGSGSSSSSSSGALSPTSVTASQPDMRRNGRGEGERKNSRKSSTRRPSTSSSMSSSVSSMPSVQSWDAAGAAAGGGNKPRRPQLPSLPQPAPPPPPRFPEVAIARVSTADASTGDRKSLHSSSLHSSATAPLLRTETALPRTPSLLLPLGAGGSTGSRVMASSSLLPPAMGTPSQVANVRNQARAHNLSSTLRRIDKQPTPTLLQSLSETYSAYGGSCDGAHPADAYPSSHPAAYQYDGEAGGGGAHGCGNRETGSPACSLTRSFSHDPSGGGRDSGAAPDGRMGDDARRQQPGEKALYASIWSQPHPSAGISGRGFGGAGARSVAQPSGAAVSLADGEGPREDLAALSSTLDGLLRTAPAIKMARFDSSDLNTAATSQWEEQSNPLVPGREDDLQRYGDVL